MIIPIRTDYRMTRTPWVNYLLVASNVIIFLVGYRGSNRGWIDPLLLHPDLPQLHQFVSSVFLHANLSHLIGNMIFLWVFGNAINDRFGHVGYLAFYLAGGVLACVGYVLLGATAPVLGASGAISAVTGAYLVLFPRVRVTLLLWFWLLTTFELSSLLFLLFQILHNVWMSMSGGLAGGGGVAYTAHLSGYAFGIVAAAMLLVTRILPRDLYDLLGLLRATRRRQRFKTMVNQGFDPFRSGDPGQRLRDQAFSRRVSTRTVSTVAPDSTPSREMDLRREISEACRRNDLPDAARLYLELVDVTDQAVLAMQNQLDVANQLMSTDRHPEAASAYERFLEHYRSSPHVADIHLMLGLIYARYLHQPDRAEPLLRHAAESLRDPRKQELANSELENLRPNGADAAADA